SGYIRPSSIAFCFHTGLIVRLVPCSTQRDHSRFTARSEAQRSQMHGIPPCDSFIIRQKAATPLAVPFKVHMDEHLSDVYGLLEAGTYAIQRAKNAGT